MTKNKKNETAVGSDVRHQVAALPFRISTNGTVEILVITSRDTGRFIIPKGWKKKGHKKPDAAATEAYEEAGVTGDVQRDPIGSYTYWKRNDLDFELLEVFVYPLRVTAQRMDWPEKGQRKMAWLPAGDAAVLVSEPQLASIIRSFAENLSKSPALACQRRDIYAAG
ncbi:NUDIX hydrolase [Ensifer adhaerens]|uniref:NUDIX hydrolase n=1 Tax=Ensifer canadensis TaxID=555315 RepID=UPI0014905E94|nr:NUDIX hydrolase [Ensifer canadensis]NOV20202.1 NUDIX hydrolase [Ensifer canadensis]